MATKIDLVEALAKKLDYLNPEDARYAVDCVLDCVKEALVEGKRIEIRGFGSMSIRQRKYADRDEHYNTVYYRMSKNVEKILNKPE